MRQPIEQTFFNISLAVPNTPIPLAATLDLGNMITSFIISNPSTNGNSVFLGDMNVTTTSGIEIVKGASPQLAITQERQMYELQDPLLLAGSSILCQQIGKVEIPIIVWKPSNIFLIAPVAGPTTVGIMFFRQVYV